MAATKAINETLQIIRLNGKRFKYRQGYIMPRGYAFYNPAHGFLAFKDSPFSPYNPKGGKKALQSILDTGGFINFDDVVWISEM